jgi:tryptophan-rich sensory protein
LLVSTELIISAGVAVFLGIAGGLLTDVGPWYRALRKPKLNPPDWLFGPAWTIILGLAAWAAAIAWDAASGSAERTTVLMLFSANAVLHLLWSPLFFKLKRPDWALLEVAFLWLSLVALVVALAPISRLASLLILPYLLWVSFATWLNWQIVRLNPRSGGQAQPSGAAE